VISIAIAIMLAQTPSCSAKGAALVASARSHADAFDLQAAVRDFDAAASAGCVDARLPAAYLRGLVAAREAYRFGGSAESLQPVERAIEQMDSGAWRSAGDAEVARFVLRAAIAAAQSERDVLGLLIGQAVDLEAQRRSAGLPGAPIVSAQEAAGDLWLQVHRYEDARLAYARAGETIGATRRVLLGLARAAVRLSDAATACEKYRALVSAWRTTAESPQIAEARAYLREPQCAARPPR